MKKRRNKNGLNVNFLNPFEENAKLEEPNSNLYDSYDQYMFHLKEHLLSSIFLSFTNPILISKDLAYKRRKIALEIEEIRKGKISNRIQKALQDDKYLEKIREGGIKFNGKPLITYEVVEMLKGDLSRKCKLFVTQDGIIGETGEPIINETELGCSYFEMQVELGRLAQNFFPEVKNLPIGITGEGTMMFSDDYHGNSRYIQKLKEVYNVSNIYIVEYNRRESPVIGDLVMKAQKGSGNNPICPKDIFVENGSFYAYVRDTNGNFILENGKKKIIHISSDSAVLSTMLESDFKDMEDSIGNDNEKKELIYEIFTSGKLRFIQHPAIICFLSKGDLGDYKNFASEHYTPTYTGGDRIKDKGIYYNKPKFGNSGDGVEILELNEDNCYIVKPNRICQKEIKPMCIIRKVYYNGKIYDMPCIVEFRGLLQPDGSMVFFARHAPYSNFMRNGIKDSQIGKFKNGIGDLNRSYFDDKKPEFVYDFIKKLSLNEDEKIKAINGYEKYIHTNICTFLTREVITKIGEILDNNDNIEQKIKKGFELIKSKLSKINYDYTNQRRILTNFGWSMTGMTINLIYLTFSDIIRTRGERSLNDSLKLIKEKINNMKDDEIISMLSFANENIQTGISPVFIK